MLFAYKTEKGAGQTAGQLLEKILLQHMAAVGAGDQPTVGHIFTVGRAQHFGARKQFPACFLFRPVMSGQRQINEVIF